MPCPEDGCAGVLTLKYSPKFSRHFYGCCYWQSGCKGGIGAHRDGRPLGIPANAATKRKRIEAHEVFDRLWKGDRAVLSRSDAYKWISDIMGREIHMGELNADDCDKVIHLVTTRWFNKRAI